MPTPPLTYEWKQEAHVGIRCDVLFYLKQKHSSVGNTALRFA